MSKYIGIFVFVFSLFSLGVHAGESFRFRVYLKDKGDSGYTLDNPEEYLSKESVERRNRQGISVSESDLPIAQAYLDTLSANGGKPVLESKWFSTVVVSSPDSLVAERLLRLPIVDSVKWVWKGDEEIDIPREENDTTRFMPIDKPEKSPYGYAEEQIKMLNGIKLHEAGFKGKGMRVAVVDADGICEYMNPIQRRADGFTRIPVEGQHITSLYVPHEREVIPTMECLQTGKPLLKKAYWYATSTNFLISTVADFFPLFDHGRKDGVIVFAIWTGNTAHVSESRRPLKPCNADAPYNYYTFSSIVGRDEALQECIHEARSAATSSSPGMICGESGIVPAAFVAIVLNVLLPKDDKAE